MDWVKSAAGIGTLLEDGIGDTVRVSLTEDPEFEIPVGRDLVKRYERYGKGYEVEEGVRQTAETIRHENALTPYTQDSTVNIQYSTKSSPSIIPPLAAGGALPYSPFEYKRRQTFAVDNIGGKHVPVVIADLSKVETITSQHLQSIGYSYDKKTDKWTISDAAADYVFTGHQLLNFALPGTLKVIVYPAAWLQSDDKNKYYPIFEDRGFVNAEVRSTLLNFVMID